MWKLVGCDDSVANCLTFVWPRSILSLFNHCTHRKLEVPDCVFCVAALYELNALNIPTHDRQHQLKTQELVNQAGKSHGRQGKKQIHLHPSQAR